MYIYEEISRNKVVAKAAWECLKMMYQKGYPSIDLDAENKRMREDPEYKAQEEKYPLYKRCYLPQKAYKDIQEAFSHAYRLEPELKETVECLKGYFKKPYVDVWKKDEGEVGHREIEVAEPMPEDVQKVVEKYFDMATEFFRWDGDLQSFAFSVMNYGPTSNRETVEKYYRENGQPDFTIPEDSTWDDDDEEDDTKLGM